MKNKPKTVKKPKAHPEDKIYKAKSFIKELTVVQDKYFDKLCADLRLHPTLKDRLFDYIFNSEDEIGFDEYLEHAGLKYKTR